MAIIHILWHDKNRECSINNLPPYGDIVIYKKSDLPKINFQNVLFLQIDAEPLGQKDINNDLLIIDMPWKEALQFSKKVPQSTQRRSIYGFKTGYPKTKPSSIRPEQGLRTIECIFAAKILMQGIADEKLLDKYYFKDKFLEINKGIIGKYKKNCI